MNPVYCGWMMETYSLSSCGRELPERVVLSRGLQQEKESECKEVVLSRVWFEAELKVGVAGSELGGRTRSG